MHTARKTTLIPIAIGINGGGVYLPLAIFLFVNAALFTPCEVSAQGQGGALWQPSGQNVAYTMRSIGIKTSSPLYDADVNGSLHSRTAVVDSILSCWEVMVSDILSVGNKLIVGGKISAAGISVTGLAESGSILTGNITSSNINADSISANHISATGLSTVSINSQNYFYNGNLINIPQIQSDIQNGKTRITALETTTAVHDSLLSNITSSQWQNNDTNIYFNSGFVGIGTPEPSETLEINGRVKITGTAPSDSVTPPTPAPNKSIIIDGGIDRITATSGTLDFDNTNLTTTGNIQSASITTINITITDNIKTKSAEFDTLKVIERMQVENSLTSDTLHALKSLEVNNSLRLVRDTAEMYAEVSTSDTAVALMLQKDPSASVEIGEAAPTPAGEARAKLTVQGSTKLNGNLNLAALADNAEPDNRLLIINPNGDVLGGIPFDFDPAPDPSDPNAPEPCSRTLITAWRRAAAGSNNIKLCDQYQNVGIGINPQARLHVNGDALFSGNVGVGISNPLHKLSVSNGQSNFVSVQLTNSSTGQGQQDGLCMGLVDGNAFFKNFEGGAFSFFDITTFSTPMNITSQNIEFFQFFALGTPPPPTIKFNADGGGYFSGNVGIGTTSPNAKLVVADNTMANAMILHSGNSNAPRLNLVAKSDEVYIEHTYASSQVPFHFKIGGTNAITINNGVNVGIGTTNPQKKLEVNNGGLASPNGILISSYVPTLYFQNQVYTDGHNWHIAVAEVGANSTFTIKDETANAHRLLIDGNGNVGIGITNPQQKLDVAGIIRTCEVQVRLNSWCDYVFDDSYKLAPLNEVEKYIKANRHLPEVPSAKEVEKEGVLLGEVNTILLKKVEELTLYMIDHDKKLELLKKENDQLKQQLELLKAKN